MPSSSSRYFSDRLFWGFASAYGLVWFLLPMMVQKNLRPDSIEQMFVGREWVLSSTKHPSLTAWMLELMNGLTGRAEWGTYLLSQIAVLAVLWCIWTLGKEYLPNNIAFLAVLLCCNYRYLNIGSVYFHHSVSILPFWALATLFFYKAIKEEKTLFWVLTGVFTGLGLLCKYPMGILALSFVVFVAIEPKARKQWKGFLLTTLVAFCVFAPHFFWLVCHDFCTLKYAGYISRPEKGLDHLINPLIFLGGQCALLLPVAIPLIPLLGWRWKPEPAHWRFRIPSLTGESPREPGAETETEAFKNRFLPVLILLPVVIQVVVGIAGGGKMRSGLGTYLWLYFPIFLLYGFHVSRNRIRLRRAFQLALLILVGTMVCFVGHFQWDAVIGKSPARTAFPGRRLAEEAENVWHRRYAVPLPYVAGEWELGGNVAFYGKDRPSVHAFGGPNDFSSPEPITTWSTDEDLNRRGALVLWTIREGQDPFPLDLFERFPRAESLKEQLEIPFQTRKAFPPLRVGIAIIPPKTVE